MTDSQSTTTYTANAHKCIIHGCPMPGSIASGADEICRFHHGVTFADAAAATKRIREENFMKVYKLSVSMINGPKGFPVSEKQKEWLDGFDFLVPYKPDEWPRTSCACGLLIIRILTEYANNGLGKASRGKQAATSTWQTALELVKAPSKSKKQD